MTLVSTPKRLIFEPGSVDYIPNFSANLYTAPGAGPTIITKITVHNSDGSPQDLTMWIGGTTDADLILPTTSIPAGEEFVDDAIRIIPAGVEFYAQASASNSLSIAMEGIEITGTPDALEAFPTRLFKGSVPNGGGVVYTPGADQTGVIHTITLVNIDASPRTVDVYSEFSASGRYYRRTIAAGERAVIPGVHFLQFGADLSMTTDDTDVVVAIVDGAVIDASP